MISVDDIHLHYIRFFKIFHVKSQSYSWNRFDRGNATIAWKLLLLFRWISLFPKAFSDFENLKVESTVSFVDWTVQQSVRQSAELPKTAETGAPTSPLSLQAELDRLDFAEAICWDERPEQPGSSLSFEQRALSALLYWLSSN